MVRKCDFSLYVGLDLPVLTLSRVVSAAQEAIDGGATAIQLREETNDTARMITAGLALKSILDERQIPLIVNESLDAALAIGASGVQFRTRAKLIPEARRRLGEKALIGLTTFNATEAASADPELIDFIGTGPVYETAGMPDWVTPIGCSGLKAFVDRCRMPVVALGGTDVPHIADVLNTGVSGIGVPISVLTPEKVTEELRLYAQSIADYRRLTIG